MTREWGGCLATRGPNATEQSLAARAWLRLLFASTLVASAAATRAHAQAPATTGAATGSQEAPASEASAKRSAKRTMEWQQIFATPRIGGRLNAVTVDPSNPNRIFVGSEEGTLMRSTDGGVTWLEFEITPFVAQDRKVGVLPPPKPDVNLAPGDYFQLFVDPPGSRFSDRLGIPFDTLFFSVRPDFIKAGFFPRGPVYSKDFIHDVAASRRALTDPVKNIAICPGGRYPLLVTTNRELYGSENDGVTFMRLFTVLSPGVVYQVKCDLTHPNDILLATDFGGFHSNDGGATFDALIMGRGEMITTGGIYLTKSKDEKVHLMVHADDYVYHGDPNDNKTVLTFVYPEWGNPGTAPWKRINWGASTQDGRIWLATQDGLRASKDNKYDHWETVEGSLFNKQWLQQVIVGANEEGGERIAVIMGDFVYASDDYGKTWFPFFFGVTRRAFKQMDAAPPVPGVPPRWWAVTAGQLFATVSPKPTAGSRIDEASARWASLALKRTPRLPVVMMAALDGTLLSERKIATQFRRMRMRNFLPRVDLSFNLIRDNRTRFGLTQGTQTFQLEDRIRRTDFEVFLQGMWELRDTPMVTEQLTPVRNSVHEIRRQVGFIVEDTWHERNMHLKRIAEGMDDPLQIAVLKERIRGLDTILETWMGQSLEKLYITSRN